MCDDLMLFVLWIRPVLRRQDVRNEYIFFVRKQLPTLVIPSFILLSFQSSVVGVGIAFFDNWWWVSFWNKTLWHRR